MEKKEKQIKQLATIAGVAAAAGAAQAVIVYEDVVDTTVNTVGLGSYLWLDIEAGTVDTTNDGSEDFSLGFYGGLNDPEMYTYNGAGLVTDGTYIQRVTSGTTINNTLSFFATDGGYQYMALTGSGPWAGGGTDYVGFQLSSGNYGWIGISFNEGTSVTVHDFAYENTGADITAGAIPEPSSLALAALAGSAILAMRRYGR